MVGLKVSGTDESPVMDPDFGSLSYEVRIASSASITSGRDQAAANRTALEMWTDGVGFLRAGLDLQSLGLLSAVPSSAWSLSVVAHTKGRDAAVSWGYRVQEDYA